MGAVLLVLVLGACGGGSDDGPDKEADPASTSDEAPAEQTLAVTVTIQGSGLNARWEDFKALLAMTGSGSSGGYEPKVGNICMGKGEADLDQWKGGGAYEVADEDGTTLLAGKLDEGRVVSSGTTPDGCEFKIEGGVPTSAKFYKVTVGGEAVETIARADAEAADWEVEVDL